MIYKINIMSIIQHIPLYSLIYKVRYFVLKTKTGFLRIEKLYNTIESNQLLLTEAAALYQLAKKSKGCIVEIGAYKGGSTIILAEGSSIGNKVPVYSIDPHSDASYGGIHYPNTIKEFETNINKTIACILIKPIYDYSYNVADKIPNEIGLLFIDGDHSYEGIKRDLDCYKGKMSKNGLIAMHDSQRWGIKQAIEEGQFGPLKGWKRIGRTKSISVFKQKG